MKKRWSLTFVGMSFLTGTSPIALADNPLVSTVTQQVVAALDIAEVKALSFPQATDNAPPAVIAPTASEAGEFSVTGTAGTVYHLTLNPPTLTLNRQGGGLDTLTVDTFNTDLGLSQTLTLGLGGDTHKLGATRQAFGNVQEGIYTGDITLTAVLGPAP